MEEVLQDTGDQHDQRNVEREARAAARLVDRVDLVCIASDGARRDEQRCYVLDYGVEEGHVGRRLVQTRVKPADFPVCCVCADAAGVPEWVEDWRLGGIGRLDQNSIR